MRLSELEPRWVGPNVFAFKCPHCRSILLTCKNIVMTTQEQRELMWRELMGWNGKDGENPPHPVEYVGCKPEMAWTITGRDFNTLSVTPSLDASASGHWHGCITNGEIR